MLLVGHFHDVGLAKPLDFQSIANALRTLMRVDRDDIPQHLRSKKRSGRRLWLGLGVGAVAIWGLASVFVGPGGYDIVQVMSGLHFAGKPVFGDGPQAAVPAGQEASWNVSVKSPEEQAQIVPGNPGGEANVGSHTMPSSATVPVDLYSKPAQKGSQ
ncbi:hypothetical protein [Pseudomonas taeanensis]|nr:hypothetical protein [Pseudomonas taeanensis]